MKKLVLLRHGESEWNKENRFTGWTDVDRVFDSFFLLTHLFFSLRYSLSPLIKGDFFCQKKVIAQIRCILK